MIFYIISVGYILLGLILLSPYIVSSGIFILPWGILLLFLLVVPYFLANLPLFLIGTISVLGGITGFYGTRQMIRHQKIGNLILQILLSLSMMISIGNLLWFSYFAQPCAKGLFALCFNRPIWVFTSFGLAIIYCFIYAYYMKAYKIL